MDEAFFDLDGTVNNLPDADSGCRGHWQSHSEELHHG
jgi:hypothetical protein